MKSTYLFSTCIFLSFFTLTSYGQKKAAYTLFNSSGKKVNYNKILRSLTKADIALFGESHNNPICHWLQFEFVKDLDSKSLVIGAEMFERDNQAVLEQYLSNEIDEAELDSLARLWGNFKTDYKPVVDLAKSRGIVFVGTNIPRRYASMVYKKGFEVLNTLTTEEKSWIAPLPVAYDPELPGYKKMLEMMPDSHGGENFPKAQAIKDATMAHFILTNRQPQKLFLHLNGAYHSDNYEGILWYLKQQEPNLNYLTITTVEQERIKTLEKEHFNKADFIIAVPSSMTKTY